MSGCERTGPRIRLRTILMLVNLLVLILPLGSIYFLRLYENELVRQTESELLAQGAFIASAYRQRLLDIAGDEVELLGTPVRRSILDAMAGEEDEPYHPIPATLDLFKETILPPRPEAEAAAAPPDPLALDVGVHIAPVLQDAQRTTLAGMRVVDHNGLIVANSGQERGISLAHIPEVRRALEGFPASVLRERDEKVPAPPLASISRGTNIRVFVSLPVLLNDRIVGAVYLSRTPRSILKALYEKKAEVFAAFGAILTVAVLLGLFTSYSITRPVRALIGRTRSLSRGEKGEPYPRGRFMAAEVAQLTESFESMAEDIEFRTNYIRDFAMHVSHEFKTPLTSIRGSVELLQHYLDDMSEEQRDHFLANMVRDTERLQRLVSRLLEMARADVFEPTDESSDLAAVAESIRERFAESGLRVNIDDGIPARARIAPDVLENILASLLDNSIQHGADRVLLDIRRLDSHVEIRVADNGKGVSQANVSKVFTPFFTTNRHNGGTGLGLSIVRALLAAHKGTIELDAPAEEGAAFVIRVPRDLILTLTPNGFDT